MPRFGESGAERAIAEMEEKPIDRESITASIGFMASPIYYRVLSIGFRMRVTGGTLRAEMTLRKRVSLPSTLCQRLPLPHTGIS